MVTSRPCRYWHEVMSWPCTDHNVQWHHLIAIYWQFVCWYTIRWHHTYLHQHMHCIIHTTTIMGRRQDPASIVTLSQRLMMWNNCGGVVHLLRKNTFGHYRAQRKFSQQSRMAYQGHYGMRWSTVRDGPGGVPTIHHILCTCTSTLYTLYIHKNSSTCYTFMALCVLLVWAVFLLQTQLYIYSVLFTQMYISQQCISSRFTHSQGHESI